MKRKDALNLIRAEYAKHGEMTTIAMRTYAESRISYAAYTKAMKAGIQIFRGDNR